MIFAGLLSALGLLFLIFKFGIRRVIAYDIPIDIAVTAFLMYAFAGTYSGMIDPDATMNKLIAHMCNPPSWAQEIPLDAEGGYDFSYSK